VPHFRIANQALHQFNCCRVQPLQIIKEQRQRVLRPRERTEEAPEHQLEAILCILRRQVWNGRLFPDEEPQFGDKVDDQLATRTHGLCQGVPPVADLRFALD
jgi:hypothetical protein